MKRYELCILVGEPKTEYALSCTHIRCDLNGFWAVAKAVEKLIQIRAFGLVSPARIALLDTHRVTATPRLSVSADRHSGPLYKASWRGLEPAYYCGLRDDVPIDDVKEFTEYNLGSFVYSSFRGMKDKALFPLLKSYREADNLGIVSHSWYVRSTDDFADWIKLSAE